MQAISENQQTIRWNAEKSIPVEVNEAHQWSLRYAHAALEVAMSYIAGYNAKKLGVQDYVMQFMLNTPPGIAPQMDIAKLLAKVELNSSLEDEKFRIFRMIRPGLLSYPADEDLAKAHLANSIFYGCAS